MKISRKAYRSGKTRPPMSTVMDARITATAALQVEVPTERSRVFSPLAAAVSVLGELLITMVGMAAIAIAVPTEIMTAPTMMQEMVSTKTTRSR